MIVPHPSRFARLSAAALALAAACAPCLGAAQEPALESSPEQQALRSFEEHLRCVAAERTTLFLDAYAAATDDDRALVRRDLERRRTPGTAANVPPSLELLMQGWRTLRGEREPASDAPVVERARAELRRLVDSLDLKVAPGCFAARADGLGEAITVAVHPLYATGDARPFEIELSWISPRGEETRARKEPVDSGALARGFPLFVRPPASEPGLWHLVAELARDGASVRGVPVEVECVERLGERSAHALADAREGDAARALRHALDLLLRYGSRTSVALRPSDVLAELEHPGQAVERGLASPVELAFVDREGIEHWLWRLGPEKPARALLILAPYVELPESIFAGAQGAEWARFAKEQRAVLYATALPAALAEDSDDGPGAAALLLARIRERTAGVDLTLVARGESLARLHTSLPPEAPFPFDALCASSVVAPTPERLFRGIPRLFVAPGGKDELPASFDGRELPECLWLEGEWSPLFDSVRLPSLVARWLAWRGAARR